MKPCCDAWPKLIQFFDWMYIKNGNIALMPHLDDRETKWRVNHCPSCGADVRGVEIPREELHQPFTIL